MAVQAGALVFWGNVRQPMSGLERELLEDLHGETLTPGSFGVDRDGNRAGRREPCYEDAAAATCGSARIAWGGSPSSRPSARRTETANASSCAT